MPGPEHIVPDAMSRHPVEVPKGDTNWRQWEPRRNCKGDTCPANSMDDLEQAMVESTQAAFSWALEDEEQDLSARGLAPGTRRHAQVHTLSSPRTVTLQEVDSASARDKELKDLKQLVLAGTPAQVQEWPALIQSYFKKSAQYSVVGNTIMLSSGQGNRVVVPKALRQQVLRSLHCGHRGAAGMEARASQTMFWPGMTKNIEQTREECDTCRKIAPSQSAEPPTPLPVPDYPFQMVSSDYFQLEGYNYLVMVCRYSNWITVYWDKSCTSKTLISHLRYYMGIFGVMDEIATDGATVYMSAEVQEFLDKFGVCHRVSSAYNPHSNQRAEGAVKAAKRLIRDNVGRGGTLDTDRFLAAMLMHRNTPEADTGMSSSEVVFGRKIKDLLPIDPKKLQFKDNWQEMLKHREAAMARRHLHRAEELTRQTHQLPPLQLGAAVSVQNQHGNHPLRWDATGTVVEVGEFGKYTVKVDGSGRLTVRNRRFLRPIRTYREAISQPAPRDARASQDDAPTPATTPQEPATTSTPDQPAQPRRSLRVAKRTYAEAAGRRLSHL